MTMTYVPTWERKYDRWATEPDFGADLFNDEETTNVKVGDEISLEELLEVEEMELDESEFDL